MANPTRYNAAARREAKARRIAALDARLTNLANGTFDEYLDEQGYHTPESRQYLTESMPELAAAHRDGYDRLVAQYRTA